ncbi:zf-TFIIB domain-containing protein [Actinomadura sp. 1N219]|uniref:TFIIB-type zinc ribbon-containing protein n=1 Tax=Actinomadura sp. 1N219 TaxID=3375152 RepID=UPI0037AABD58
MHCPKCRGVMRTYTRSGVHIEQCDSCRGIFLDYGELEALAQMESQYRAAPPPAAAPGWGTPAASVHHHHHGARHHRPHGGSVFHMLFTT